MPSSFSRRRIELTPASLKYSAKIRRATAASAYSISSLRLGPLSVGNSTNIKQGTRVHFEARHGEIVLRSVTPRYFEKMAGLLGTGGKALRVLLEEKKKEREL